MHLRPNFERSSEGNGRHASIVPDGYDQCVASRGPFACVSEAGHHYAAVVEVVAGRQRAEELPTGVQFVVSLQGRRRNRR